MSYSSYNNDKLHPAQEMKIEHRIYMSDENTDISQLTPLSVERLQTMREESAAAEQAIFEKLSADAGAWDAQASNTRLLDKAIEYVRTPPVKHTANQWEKSAHNTDRYEMSNMVYSMSYYVYERTIYDRETQKSKPVAWDLSWSIYTNSPAGNRKSKIAGQDKKVYSDKADMEKYLAGRIKAYSHLFTEISPPIPQEHANSFRVNGQLLPSYVIEGEEPKPPERAAEVENGGVSISENIEQRKEKNTMNEPLNIQLSTREMNEKGETGGAWLKLPAAAEQLTAALARIGAQGNDFVISGFETPIPAIERIPLKNVQKAGIDELNFLAARLEMFGQEHIDKLNAASEIMTDGNDIHLLTEYTFCPQFYDFHPDIHNHAELGEHVIGHSGLIQIPDEWAAAIDCEKLGQLAAEHEKGLFTEHGYIVPSGEEWESVKDIPQEYQITPKIDYDTITTRTAATVTAKPPEQSKPAVTAAPFVLVADNPRDRMKEIADKLEAGIKGIFDSEQYKSYLKTLSKFHNYSFNNCLLIAMQKPDASHVGGFNFWRDDMKRPVMKGEKGIKILAPSPFKTKKTVDAVSADGKPIFDKNGRRVKEEKEITVPAFKVTSVFDVSQTDGEPLPQIGVSELTGSVDKYKDFFAALEKTSHVPIAFEAITSGAKGYYHQEEKRIAINEGMSELQNLKTAIHEIAHSRLHDIDKNAPADTPRPDRRTREVEAESIAYTVCQHYGLDTSDYSFGYVATWSSDKQLDTLKSSLDTIRKEADAIITEIDKHFAELTQSKEQTAEKPTPERQPGFEQWSEPATPENAPDNPGAPADDKSAYLPQQGDTFTIYQLRDGDETRNLRFESLAAVSAAGLAVALANYDKIYSAPLDNSTTLEKLYFTFNMDRPEDFKGHSLSISDVVVMNRDGNETAFYVDGGGNGFQELPGFLTPKDQARETPAPPIDLHAVADYLQKQYNIIQAADPNKTQGQAAFNTAVKRLDAVVERIPDEHARIKVLFSHAALSPDLTALKNRMESVNVNFIQHYSTAVQNTIDTGSKAEPKAPAAATNRQTEPAPAPKAPAQGENVAAIEAKVKAGETINLSDLSDAIKKDKAAAQTTAKIPARTNTQGKTAAKNQQPSIREQIAAGKQQLNGQKSAPARAAAQDKNKGLGD